MLKRLLGNLFAASPVRAAPAHGAGRCLQAALAAQNSGDTAAAERLLREGMAADPAAPVLPVMLAELLRKAGRDETCLECGVQWPSNTKAARALAAEGITPTALHNNCSGKHAGFICLACDQQTDPAGYVDPDHKTMRTVTAALSATTGTRLDASNRAIDGCSIPTFAIPLHALALAFARFGSGVGLSADRALAASRLRRAVAANPFMVAGTNRFDTRLMTALGARVFSKTGAEGVFCAALPELGLGLAVKCRDGAGRAAEVATAALVDRFLKPNNPDFAALLRPELHNWAGTKVGEIRPAAALLG